MNRINRILQFSWPPFYIYGPNSVTWSQPVGSKKSHCTLIAFLSLFLFCLMQVRLPKLINTELFECWDGRKLLNGDWNHCSVELRWSIKLEETVGTIVEGPFIDLNRTYCCFFYFMPTNIMQSCQHYVLLPLEVFDTLYVNCRASQQGNIYMSLHFC